MTSSPGMTDVPKSPAWFPRAILAAADDDSAIQMPRKVPTKAPTAVRNWEAIACDFVNPDLIKIE
jgi:hypothetical protein